jgi:poly(hydroxyalkanoate) granule-associated protein
MTKSKGTSIESLRASTRRIWLAGLGALAEAEKKGDELFRSLVKQGEKYEDVLRVPVERASGALKESVKTATTKASSTFHELEEAIDRRIAVTMKRAGLASREEVESLRREVARLEKRLAARSVTKPRAKKSTKTKKKTSQKRKATRTA